MGNELRRMLGATALGAILAATPMSAGFHGNGFALTASAAFAKDGESGGGNSGSSGGGGGSGGSGSGSSGGSGGGNSGSVSSGNDSSSGGDDQGGSGSGKSGGDDRGGSGGSGRGGTDDGGADDRAGDDHGGGRANGTDTGGAPGATAARGNGLRVVKFERTAAGVEVTYSNGLREEVSRGRFEQKDAAGRTLIERPVTDADLKRIAKNARNSGIVPVPIRTEATRVEVSGGTIEVTYGTGWREELEGGRYELKDPNNNTVVERPATPADISRLRALAGG